VEGRLQSHPAQGRTQDRPSHAPPARRPTSPDARPDQDRRGLHPPRRRRQSRPPGRPGDHLHTERDMGNTQAMIGTRASMGPNPPSPPTPQNRQPDHHLAKSATNHPDTSQAPRPPTRAASQLRNRPFDTSYLADVTPVQDVTAVSSYVLNAGDTMS